MNTTPGPLDVTFTGPIGIEIKGDLWSCVEFPGSVELFGTGKAIKVVRLADDEPVSLALMPNGSGCHMVSISAKVRKKLGKNVGDDVTVHLSERLS
ncbi:hypothetical protein GCM10022381_38680 [Leifsonia kafniensis]|uniref:DUF1905 domain-containing protein n=1 Tax=Leifsonia kafniensis TaxID=475957 RepID=A0ABP7L2S0_9MICO